MCLWWICHLKLLHVFHSAAFKFQVVKVLQRIRFTAAISVFRYCCRYNVMQQSAAASAWPRPHILAHAKATNDAASRAIFHYFRL